MNVSTHRHESLRFWAPTGLAGAASAGLVAMLLTAVASAPASSAPSTQVPVEPAAVTPGSYAGIAVPCFMNRHSWNDDLDGPPPRCTL
jgi:hypothetical protein